MVILLLTGLSLTFHLECVHTPWHVCGEQGTTCKNSLSSMWGLRSKQICRLGGKHLYPLDHLTSFIFPYFSYFLNRKKISNEALFIYVSLIFSKMNYQLKTKTFLNKADFSSSFKRHLNVYKGISVNISTTICYKMKALNPG